MKHIERLRKIIGIAIKNEWLDRDPFIKFKATYERYSRQFLSAEELSAIENKKFKIDRLEYAKDIFIFCCYTGLAYIDVLSLKPDNINIGIDGNYWITTFRHKTEHIGKSSFIFKVLQYFFIYLFLFFKV